MGRSITSSFGVHRSLDNVQDWSYHDVSKPVVVAPNQDQYNELVQTSALGVGYTTGDMDLARKRERNAGWVVGLAVFAGGGSVLMFAVVNFINWVR